MFSGKFLHINRLALILSLIFLLVLSGELFAQNIQKNESHTSVIRLDGNQSGWTKSDNETNQGSNSTTAGNENVSFSSTSEGIYLTINNGSYRIKLFALTGQVLFDGTLNQGRFIIQTRTGIYFLKVDNKSFKVICK
jgi:hypothetical protein